MKMHEAVVDPEPVGTKYYILAMVQTLPYYEFSNKHGDSFCSALKDAKPFSTKRAARKMADEITKRTGNEMDIVW